MKLNFESVSQKFSESNFAKAFVPALKLAVCYAVVSYGAKKLGVSLKGVPGFEVFEEKPKKVEKNANNSPYIMPAPDGPIEEAILSIWKTGMRASYDSQRQDSARKIYDMLTANNKLDDTAYSFGIKALGKIAEVMNYDSGRESIANMVAKIGTQYSK